MRLAVVTAVLLLAGFLSTKMARPYRQGPSRLCPSVSDKPCAAGWTRVDDHRCVKFINTLKTFQAAQAACSDLGADMLSVHNEDQLKLVFCQTWITRRGFWLGAQRSGSGFEYLDGSDFDYSGWSRGQPDNVGGHEDCVVMRPRGGPSWNDANCSEKKSVVCAKKM